MEFWERIIRLFIEWFKSWGKISSFDNTTRVSKQKNKGYRAATFVVYSSNAKKGSFNPGFGHVHDRVPSQVL